MSVTMEELADQRDRGWPDLHPEDFCERCGRRNIVWTADSDRFNLAVGRAAIVCPSCFVLAHEEATGLTCMWELRPASVFKPTGAASWESRARSALRAIADGDAVPMSEIDLLVSDSPTDWLSTEETL